MKPLKAILMISGLFVSLATAADDIKLATVDIKKIFDAAPIVAEAQANIKLEQEEDEEANMKMINEVRVLVEEIAKIDKALGDPDLKKAGKLELEVKRADLMKKGKELEIRRMAVKEKKDKDMKDKIAKQLDEKLAIIKGFVKQVAKDKGYVVVFDTSKTTPNNIIYSEKSIDISDLVIEAMHE